MKREQVLQAIGRFLSKHHLKSNDVCLGWGESLLLHNHVDYLSGGIHLFTNDEIIERLALDTAFIRVHVFPGVKSIVHAPSNIQLFSMPSDIASGDLDIQYGYRCFSKEALLKYRPNWTSNGGGVRWWVADIIEELKEEVSKPKNEFNKQELIRALREISEKFYVSSYRYFLGHEASLVMHGVNETLIGEIEIVARDRAWYVEFYNTHRYPISDHRLVLQDGENKPRILLAPPEGRNEISDEDLVDINAFLCIKEDRILNDYNLWYYHADKLASITKMTQRKTVEQGYISEEVI